MTKKESKSQRS